MPLTSFCAPHHQLIATNSAKALRTAQVQEKSMMHLIEIERPCERGIRGERFLVEVSAATLNEALTLVRFSLESIERIASTTRTYASTNAAIAHERRSSEN